MPLSWNKRRKVGVYFTREGSITPKSVKGHESLQPAVESVHQNVLTAPNSGNPSWNLPVSMPTENSNDLFQKLDEMKKERR